MNLTKDQKATLMNCRTIRQLLDELNKIADLNTAELNIFNRAIIVEGLQKALILTRAKPKL
jgi:hypothetical protein